MSCKSCVGQLLFSKFLLYCSGRLTLSIFYSLKFVISSFHHAIFPFPQAVFTILFASRAREILEEGLR